MEHVAAKTTDIATRVAEHFGITRQAACKHLRKLTQERALIASGNTRNRLYRLAPLREWSGSYAIAAGLEEDRVGRWTLRLNSPSFPKMLLTYGSSASLKCSTTRSNTQEELLELSKGKLTTDPRNHSGQGIFFTSRMLDSFDILSGGVMFTHKMGAHPDFILEMPKFEGGTTIFMELQNDTARTCKKIFDQYSSDDNYDFSKTVIPVKLAQYGNDKLVSRSQAKRLLSRVDLFKTVVFDFAGVETIGQAFADEIFRVFARNHPNIALIPLNSSEEISKLVAAAETAKRADQQTRLVTE